MVNRSLEQAAGSVPLGWVPTKSGTNNAILTYPQAGGRTDSRYVSASATQYTSGTAKWYSAPVGVTPGQPYRLSTWYRSNTTSEILVEFRSSAGTSTYTWLGTVAPAVDWTQITRLVTPPAAATAMAFWQGLTGAGFVDNDDYSMTLDAPPPPPPPPSGLVPNGSFEVGRATQPTSWIPINSGLNTSTLAFPTTGGRNGGRYVRAETTQYTSGDAKWYFAPVPVTAGQTYRFNSWHRSNGASEIMVEFRFANGTSTYTYRGQVTPSPDNWSKHTQAVTAPANAIAMSFWHALRGVGFLDTDDHSLVLDNGTAFSRPLASITFDDGFATNLTIAQPALQNYAMTGTFYLAPGLFNAPGYLTNAQVTALASTTVEIGSHTVTHSDLVTLSPAAELAELENSKSTLATVTGRQITAFASPFGSYDTDSLIRIQGLYASHRTTNDGLNLRTGLDRYQIKRTAIYSTTTAADVAGWCQQAVQQGAWLVLVYHELSANPGFFSTTPGRFTEHLQALQTCAIATRTVTDALAELLPQIP